MAKKHFTTFKGIEGEHDKNINSINRYEVSGNATLIKVFSRPNNFFFLGTIKKKHLL